MKADWDFAQRELRENTSTKTNNNSFHTTGVDNSNSNNMAGDDLVEQERELDANENAPAKSEVPGKRKEDSTKQPHLSEGADRLVFESEGEQKGDSPSSPASGGKPSPSRGPLAAALEISRSSEMMGVDLPPCPGGLPVEMSAARLTRSEEMSQTAPASAPGAPEAVASPSTQTQNNNEDCLAPQTQCDVSGPSPSSGLEPPSSTSVLPVPRPSSHGEEIVQTLPASDRDASAAMAAVAVVAQNKTAQNTKQKSTQSCQEDSSAAPTEAEFPDTDSGKNRQLDPPPSNTDAEQEDGRHSQATYVAPPSPPSPLPPPSLKARRQNEAELTASNKAIHVNKATLMELQRAREAWRGAEGELERSQEERDELRATLQAVGTIRPQSSTHRADVASMP